MPDLPQNEAPAAPSLQRPARYPNFLSPGASVGVTPAQIAAIVEDFYAAVRADAMLGPIFNAAIDDWPAHLEKLKAFWGAVVLVTGCYKGNVIGAHDALPHMDEAHMSQWLGLFQVTLLRHCTPQQAAVFTAPAGRIAGRLLAAQGA